VRARCVQSWWRMLRLRLRFVEHKAAATFLQAWARMNISRAAYKVAAQEAKEQAKMENQLAALQKRLDDEALARAKMEAENAALQQRLLSVDLFGTFFIFDHSLSLPTWLGESLAKRCRSTSSTTWTWDHRR
jgi:hypothetical protein